MNIINNKKAIGDEPRVQSVAIATALALNSNLSQESIKHPNEVLDVEA